MDVFVELMATIGLLAIMAALVAVPVSIAMAHNRTDRLERRVADLESDAP